MSLKSRSTVNAHDFFTFFSKMGARQGLAQTHIAAYDHEQCSAPPIDLVWLTWSWMIFLEKRNLGDVNGWGALHLRNDFELQRFDSSWALSRSVAVRSLNKIVVTRTRSRDGSLPNR